jgi:hypothetical protein
MEGMAGKNPHNLCLAAKATLGMAGVLRERLCSKTGFFKALTVTEVG